MRTYAAWIIFMLLLIPVSFGALACGGNGNRPPEYAYREVVVLLPKDDASRMRAQSLLLELSRIGFIESEDDDDQKAGVRVTVRCNLPVSEWKDVSSRFDFIVEKYPDLLTVKGQVKPTETK